MDRKLFPSLLLRIGLAFVFTYAAYETFLDPSSLIGYTPDFIFDLIPPSIFMYSFAIFEVLLSLWLLSGIKVWIPALMSAALMISIIIFNLAVFAVVFRNVAIMFAALSLATMHLDIKGVHSDKSMESVAISPPKIAE